MKKIKIVNIISRLVYGGTESVLLNYYSHIDRKHYDLSIITMEAVNKEVISRFEKLGFKVYIVGDWEKQPIEVGKEILKLLKKEKYDIIHSHLSHTNFYFMILGYIAGIKIRISHSHLAYIDKTLIEKIKHKIYKILINIFSTNYMACSEAAALELYGTTKNIYILHNAIDVNKFKYNEKTEKTKRKELKIKDKDIVIGHIGRFEKQKNHEFLIDIFNEIHKQNKNTILLLVGEGPLKEEIEQKVKNLNLEKSVKFLGQRSDVNELYQAMDAFVLPSLYEGLPLVGVEAQAAGLPCFFSTEVTKETKVLETTKLIELTEGPQKWASIILKELKSYKRVDTAEEITKNKFNISMESTKLDNYYQKNSIQ